MCLLSGYFSNFWHLGAMASYERRTVPAAYQGPGQGWGVRAIMARARAVRAAAAHHGSTTAQRRSTRLNDGSTTAQRRLLDAPIEGKGSCGAKVEGEGTSEVTAAQLLRPMIARGRGLPPLGPRQGSPNRRRQGPPNRRRRGLCRARLPSRQQHGVWPLALTALALTTPALTPQPCPGRW